MIAPSTWRALLPALWSVSSRVCLVGACASPVAAQTTLTLSPTGDTYLQEISPDQNVGTSQELLFGRGVGFGLGNIRTLVEFDLGELPHGNVREAVFSARQYKTEPAAGTIDCNLHRCTEPWAETVATWNAQPAYDNEVWATAPVGDGPWGWVDWTVTDLVRAQAAGEFPSHGWLFRVPFETSGISRLGYFRSREYTANPAQRPKLYVELYDLDLTVPPLAVGEPAALVVERAEPHSAVALAIDFTQPGLTPIVRLGIVLEMHFPQPLGVLFTDGEGQAVLQTTVPPEAAGLQFWLQAMAPGKVSNLVEVVVP